MSIVGFAPGPSALSFAVTVQAETVQLQQIIKGAVMDAFLSNLNNTAVSSLVARGLKVTGVTLTTSASFSPSALNALYSVSTTSSLHVNPSAYYDTTQMMRHAPPMPAMT